MNARLPTSVLFNYGFFGLPLAMVALPVYVHAPQFYASRFELSLSAIGITLLVARLFDAFSDPLIGAWVDRTKLSGGHGACIAISLPLLALGFGALFHPPAWIGGFALAWFALALLVATLGFSIATIAYQSWGAALSQSGAERTRITAAREGWGLGGIVLAAAVPAWLGFDALIYLFLAGTAAGAWLLLLRAPRASKIARVPQPNAWMSEPFGGREFRWLYGVFAINGIAAAVPATLFFFFAQDRLGLGEQAGLFLVLYFLAGAASMPIWARLARRFGEARAWLGAMLLAIAAFVWSFWLNPGSVLPFGVICLMAGLALGADLALPPALLAAIIARAGHGGHEGTYFGAWNWITKLNLALAAGVALPLLEQLGYEPGVQTPQGVHSLGVAYALLPCGLKLAAAMLLWRSPLREI
jgi:glycoside/pentoside/hexuronide:cation symporter, GPH family